MSPAKKSKQKEEKPALARPSAMMPVATVQARHLGGMVSRQGRGFSVREISGAGVPMAAADKWGLPTDPLRRSSLDPNVKALEKWYSPVAKAAAEPPKEPEPAAKPEAPTEKPKAKKKAVRKKKAEG